MERAETAKHTRPLVAFRELKRFYRRAIGQILRVRPHSVCDMITHFASIPMIAVNQSQLLSLLWPTLLCVSVYIIYNFIFHPLAHVPGPLSAHLGIPWFRTYATVTRTYAWRLQRMHVKYGSVVRLGPNFVSTTDPDAVHTLYAYSSPFRKTRFYTALSKSQSLHGTMQVSEVTNKTDRLHPVKS